MSAASSVQTQGVSKSTEQRRLDTEGTGGRYRPCGVPTIATQAWYDDIALILI
jgi:hypothetical protein